MKYVIPVAVFHDEGEAQRQLSVLMEEFPIAEITFRTPYAAEAISLCRKRFPTITAGAGSIVNAEQARLAICSGAQFIVSPGLSEDILSVCAKENIPYLPGAVTPTELMRALSMGLSAVKFFPARVFGGIAAISALSAPFPQMKFVPTGGVGEGNLKEYLSHPNVAAVGGSFMFGEDMRETLRRIRTCLQEVNGGLS